MAPVEPVIDRCRVGNPGQLRELFTSQLRCFELAAKEDAGLLFGERLEIRCVRKWFGSSKPPKRAETQAEVHGDDHREHGEERYGLLWCAYSRTENADEIVPPF